MNTIDILFTYQNTQICETIDISKIDKNHYENMWDWWFKIGKECLDNNLKNSTFEIIADKNENGQYTLDNLIINVYKNDEDFPCDTVKEFSYRKSWIDDKCFR